MDRNEFLPLNSAPPPPPGFSIPAPQSVTVHVLTFGPDPHNMKCPYCEANITTDVFQKPGTKAHVIAILLCVFGCWPCAPCPYCIGACLISNHYCPECNKFLGQYER